MLSRTLKRGVFAAAAGAVMLSAVGSASAFTLASPSPAASVAGANIDHVWYDQWGRWHPNHPRWGWGPAPWRHRHCWRGPWGHLHCGW